MTEILLIFFIVLGLSVGILDSFRKLENNTTIIKHSSIFNYWLGK
jgi:hypothetical protein